MIAREFGNCNNIKIVQNRGYGKSWLIAWCCCAMAVLYPGSNIAVVSATATQATIVLRKIQSFVALYPQLMCEINVVGRDPVVISKDKGTVRFLNSSKIESFSLSTVVGERAKIVVIDEAPRASEKDIRKNAIPVANTTRDMAIQNGFEDYDSKIVSITSACLKSNYFFSDFVDCFNGMREGNEKNFACALDWRSAVRVGISKQGYFEDRRKELPESVFATEYGSMFLGEEANSIFPYDLTEQCRTLQTVEYSMPKGTTCYYVMSVDIATSQEKGADNTCISVIKCYDRDDGSIMKYLVYLRTYHGKRLDDLAEEIRMTYVRFPKIIKVIFDQRGLGDSLPAFFKDVWVDPQTGKEYPAWLLDDGKTMPGSHGVPMLVSFKANVALNQELVTRMRVALEQKLIAFPVAEPKEADGKAFTLEEKAIYLETDALQVECGNIVMRVGASNMATYDTAKANQHKDRYSSVAMAVWYIGQLEDERKQKIRNARAGTTIGIVSNFD